MPDNNNLIFASSFFTKGSEGERYAIRSGYWYSGIAALVTLVLVLVSIDFWDWQHNMPNGIAAMCAAIVGISCLMELYITIRRHYDLRTRR